MHLGRFHYVVDHLEHHFREAQIAEQLEAAAKALEQFHQSRAESHIAAFRTHLAKALDAADDIAPELLQPYAQQVIDELGLRFLFPPEIRTEVGEIVALHSFDSASLAAAIRRQSEKYSEQIEHLDQLDSSLRGLNAEYTEVEAERAEIGLLLPREAVGERLPELSKEFDRLSYLIRAVNELTGQPEYDSRVVTISSSWWQVFLDIPIEQIALWTFAIERIVALFKNNLEIKNLQRQLGEHDIPEQILKTISDAVDKKVSAELETIASDLVKKFGKVEEAGRKNEVETQLRQGLHYLAKRINEGAQVELNVGIPEDPEDPEVVEGETPDQEALAANQKLRGRIAHLQELRIAAMNASETSRQIDMDAPLLLEDVKHPDDKGK